MSNASSAATEHRGLIALMIIAAFVFAGGIHYQTPMLAAIAAEFHADAATTGWIPTLSFGGMMLGILFFVPLGDRIDKRRLVLSKLIILTLAQAGLACCEKQSGTGGRPAERWLPVVPEKTEETEETEETEKSTAPAERAESKAPEKMG